MSLKIETQDDLGQDLAGTHKIFRRDNPVDPAQTEAEFKQLQRDGFIMMHGLYTPEQLDELRAQSAPYLQHMGRNNFEGYKTQRIYNVFSKMRALDSLAEHPRVLALLDKLFMPNYRLSQALLINLLPGEEAQPLHYDDGFYKVPRPRAALGAATILAVDDFTEDNGATVYIPGSHLWGEGRPDRSKCVPAVMPAGSAIFFLGTLWHGGGGNTSDRPRLAATCQYCEPWLRQQANFTLEIPREIAAQLSEPIQSMIGYSIHPPFMGMVNGMHPKRLLSE
ncbi:MAG: phytanoyl-CoA dioxygenase family protein [Acidobacteriota bacterium]|nr:phytanoyl-CoA dioxygenase family protein [Acidobacteriota bacterium]